jgi:hypothetical protein
MPDMRHPPKNPLPRQRPKTKNLFWNKQMEKIKNSGENNAVLKQPAG